MQIYKLLFKDGSSYIGQTSRALEVRFKEHVHDMLLNRHHSFKVQNKYNELKELPIVETLEDNVHCTELSNREMFWIKKYDTHNNGLNCTDGGESSNGSNNNASKYDQLDYIMILYNLANTDYTFKEISEDLNVSINVVRQISNQQSHLYLRELCPKQYSLMCLKSENRRTTAKRRTAYPHVRSPNNEIFTIINATKFAKEHGLHQSKLSLLLNGSRKSHKGWTLA